MNDREMETWWLWKKRPRGRPSGFTKDLAERIYLLARYGMTDTEIAWGIGIGEATLHRWKHGSVVFKEKLQAAKAEADAVVEQALYNLARGMTLTETTVNTVTVDYTRGVAIRETVTEREIRPDLGAIMTWLCNRRPDRWSAKPRPVVQNLYHPECGISRNVGPKARLIAAAVAQVLNTGVSMDNRQPLAQQKIKAQ